MRTLLLAALLFAAAPLAFAQDKGVRSPAAGKYDLELDAKGQKGHVKSAESKKPAPPQAKAAKNPAPARQHITIRPGKIEKK